MLNSKFKILTFSIFIFCLLFCNLTVNGTVNGFNEMSQEFSPAPSDTVEKTKIIRDTFSFKYHFQKGDTLIYSVFSRDSIIINYGAPLLRLRHEKIMLTCDSITPEGDFCLTQKLISFRSSESFLNEKNIQRNTTPWLNVPVFLELDSMGRRKKSYHPDTLNGALTPGGAFQPFLLLPLLDSNDNVNRKLTNESWMFTRTDDIHENGLPIPLLRYSLLYRMIGFVDTLEYKSLLKMTFIKTSQGSIVVKSDDLDVATASINNAGGEIFWDTTNWVPILYFQTVEQRLTIYDEEGQTVPGFHYIYSTFVLDDFIRK